MKVLIDTHIAILAISDDGKLLLNIWHTQRK